VIARLRGPVIEAEDGSLVIDCAGVGYQVFCPLNVLGALGLVGEEADLYVRQVFREDGTTLYGFANPRQRRLFDLLTSVKGCGPRIGLAILSTLTETGAAAAIAGEDLVALTKTPGVGKRMAERIVLELREKIQEEALSDGAVPVGVGSGPKPSGKADPELVEALLALGYRQTEAERAAEAAAAQADSLEDRLKAAIRSLSG
jgi:Holliday junction DNA helicase RuvA